MPGKILGLGEEGGGVRVPPCLSLPLRLRVFPDLTDHKRLFIFPLISVSPFPHEGEETMPRFPPTEARPHEQSRRGSHSAPFPRRPALTRGCLFARGTWDDACALPETGTADLCARSRTVNDIIASREPDGRRVPFGRAVVPTSSGN